MPRYNVKHNNKWACFSSIVDDFITDFVSLEEYERWRDLQYGEGKNSLEATLRMDMDEALEIIKTIHGEDRFNEIKIKIDSEEIKHEI